MSGLHDAIGTIATFGDDCRFIPKSGPPRDIRAVIDDDGSYVDGDTSHRVETIAATVLKDKDTETYGGIDELERGDVLQLVDDPAERRFGYTGRYAEADAYKWKLFFERRVLVTIGGNNRK